ncbi:MAG: pyridoxal-phosphate dependent enzyme, partial [Nannocystaceae bacterium]
NVAGSHKARHLAGVMLYLQTLRAHGRLSRGRELAIASCGNAALAAATLARATDWPIRVFVPQTVDPHVLARLHELGAQVVVCSRTADADGDPCYTAFIEAVENGSLPFCCQGPDNGLCIEGGQTLAYELLDQLRPSGATLDWLVIQVGGGALASACVAGLREAVRAGVLSRMPRICTVQTTGAWPLARAYHRLVARRSTGQVPDQPNSPILATVKNFSREVVHELTHSPSLLQNAAQSRNQWMQPWPEPPVSVAHGILDDETYDWFALVRAMQETGGFPLVAEEAQLVHAQQAACDFTGRPITATGAAGLAGVLELQRRGDLAPHQTVGVLVTGRQQEP